MFLLARPGPGTQNNKEDVKMLQRKLLQTRVKNAYRPRFEIFPDVSGFLSFEHEEFPFRQVYIKRIMDPVQLTFNFIWGQT